MTKDAQNAYEAWESAIGAPAVSDQIPVEQKKQLCDNFHKALLSYAAKTPRFVMFAGGRQSVPQSLKDWHSDIIAREEQYDCSKEQPIPLKARSEPSEDTTAKELEVTFPPNEARPDQKTLVCNYLRKQQLQIFNEMSQAYLSGSKPEQALLEKLQAVEISQKRWGCPISAPQGLKARSVDIDSGGLVKRIGVDDDNEHLSNIMDGLGQLGDCETSGKCSWWKS